MNMQKRQAGFSLIAAIFLIVVIAGLIAFMVITSGVSQQTPQLGLTGARAYHAARSGLEWGIYEATQGAGNCNSTFTLNAGAFDGYQVVVNCTSSTHNDGQPSQPVTIYQITATASKGTPGSLQYATRTLRAVVSPTGPL